MSVPSVGHLRLVAQGLVTRPFATPVDAVTAFGAMQGQDLPGALASAALRTQGGTVADVIAALDAGDLVRGYPMRGTVFLMPASDVTWMTQLCAAPSLRAAGARRHQLELDDEQIGRGRELALELLSAGPASRRTLFARWDEAGLRTQGGRGYHLLFVLVAETTLCYGPWNGTDQDVAVASTWLPAGGSLQDRFAGERIPAVAEMLRRYLTSHGPATIRDFAWWTKLPLKEIRAALPLVADDLESDREAEASYWRPGLLDEAAALGREAARPLLLPGFDEFVLGYQDRLFAMSQDEHARLVPGNNGVFKKSVVLGGRVVGTWARAGKASRRVLEIDEFTSIGPRHRGAIERRFEAYPFVGG